jgi:RNA 3'-terminal phosphate cyclase (ATP)
MVKIDGSMGEGGGQVLRTSLALSLVTGVPFRIENIRGGRKKSGLLRQHLTAVSAAAEISGAEVVGAEMGGRDLIFLPGKIKPGEYSFSVGTAGSATLVLQAVLPALITADGKSKLVLEGGTHNPFAPPFDFLEKAFLPCLRRMGSKVVCSLQRPGYYPAGGGRFSVAIEPSAKLTHIEINERGELIRRHARAVVSKLPEHIAQRELETVSRILNWRQDELETERVTKASGPGNVLILETHFEHITEVFTGFGELGVAAEDVAEKTSEEVSRYLASGAPVGKYLADQLLLPMAMAGKGSFRTVAPTRHTFTNIDVVRRFLDIDIQCQKLDDTQWQLIIG